MRHVYGTRHITVQVLLDPNFTQIFSGNQPWVVRSNAEKVLLMNNVRNGKRPPNPGDVIEARYWGLIDQCWSAAPDSRPKMSDVLKRLQ